MGLKTRRPAGTSIQTWTKDGQGSCWADGMKKEENRGLVMGKEGAEGVTMILTLGKGISVCGNKEGRRV